MTTVADILEFMESLAPASLKMEWDNVGLLCGSKNTPVAKILVALDPFEHVCREAAEVGAQLIVTHHPLIFRPVSSVTDASDTSRSILFLCANGISAINAHTNLDQVSGGVNDVLAAALGMSDITLITPEGTDPEGRPYGLLRMGTVQEQPLDTFLAVVKENLHCEGLRYVSGGKAVRRVAVGGGACADGMYEAASAGCDTFVTSDVKYNGFWDAKFLGLNLIDAGHFHTENPVVAVLAEKLRAAFPEIEVKISESHADCVKYC